MTSGHVDSLDLLHRTTLQRRHFTLIAFKELAEGGSFEDLRIGCSTEAINLGFKITRPLLGFLLRVEGFAARLHATPTHLRLPASSEFADRRHVISNRI
jgi:hypothetical protein